MFVSSPLTFGDPCVARFPLTELLGQTIRFYEMFSCVFFWKNSSVFTGLWLIFGVDFWIWFSTKGVRDVRVSAGLVDRLQIIKLLL